VSTGGPAEYGDPDFIAGMARELDASARRLEAREAELVAQLGADRVAELAGLWAKEMDPHDEAELKRNMDWTDKELIWVWSRLERARARRVLAGRQAMLHMQYGPDTPNTSKDTQQTEGEAET
jgi:hypothetical protein